MSKVRLTLVLVTVFAVAAAVAGCGSSTGSGSSTTSSAPATTSTATTDTTTTTTSAATRTAKTTTAARATATAVAAGKTYFDNTCQGCHSASGTEAGVGPRLAAAGLTADRVRNQVENGGDIMPPGLASGTDLDNVVAYVLSIQ
jgi:mono/diheme cytochrome c family protein